jgi:hypothetical protein
MTFRYKLKSVQSSFAIACCTYLLLRRGRTAQNLELNGFGHAADLIYLPDKNKNKNR